MTSALRDIVDSLNEEALGEEMHTLVRELYPVPRSLTGDGVRDTLRTLARVAPLELHEVPTGTRVFDWTVPREWNLRSARLVGPDGAVIVDAAHLNLHVVGYSTPFHGRMTLEQLQPHLHTLPDRPALVPYRTSYYAEDWGFCLSEERRAALAPGEYEVSIDTTLTDGSLTYAELALPGTTADEVLISAHVCHPSLANDNLSGVVVAATLARLLAAAPRRYTYRFVFAPATIGAITWLARNEDRTSRIAHGLVLAGIGDGGPFTYKRSRRGNAPIDRAAAHVLAHTAAPHAVVGFVPYGYDERQYCSPGFDLPVGSLSRSTYGQYPEYHTSADDLELVRPEHLASSLRVCLEMLEVLEGDGSYVTVCGKGEPQLGKRGLYESTGAHAGVSRRQLALLWVLNLSDGAHSLLDIAEQAQMPFAEVRRAADALEATGLLHARDGGA